METIEDPKSDYNQMVRAALPNLAQAVKELRRLSCQTQQEFASGLGLAVVSISRYERGSHPDLGASTEFFALARKLGADELAYIFADEMLRQIRNSDMYKVLTSDSWEDFIIPARAERP